MLSEFLLRLRPWCIYCINYLFRILYEIHIMFRILRTAAKVNCRSFKNFGHKRQPEPIITTLWLGFLTFTFIGLGIEWNRMKKLVFGDKTEIEDTDLRTQIEP